MLDWKFESFPEMQYNLITTTNVDGAPGVGGGMGKRMDPSQRIMNYFGVKSIDAAMNKVKSLGGSVLMGKMAVPKMGYLANCVDTEGNFFGLWEEDAGHTSRPGISLCISWFTGCDAARRSVVNPALRGQSG